MAYYYTNLLVGVLTHGQQIRQLVGQLRALTIIPAHAAPSNNRSLPSTMFHFRMAQVWQILSRKHTGGLRNHHDE